MTPALVGLAIGLLIALACAGYGMLALRALRLRGLSAAAEISLGLGLGFGGLTTGLYWLGLGGLLFRPLIAALICGGAVLGVGLIVGVILDRRRAAPTTKRALSLAARLVLALTAVCVAANLIGAAAPPSFIDALVYHLYVPQQFLKNHGVVELSGIWQHYQAIAVEMLYLTALVFRSPIAASILCAGLGVLAASAAYLLGARLGGRLVGLVAVAIFYDNAMTAWESTSCFVELAVAALGPLGLYAVCLWDEDRRPAWLGVAGLLLGFAASCKLNAAAFAIIGALMVVHFSLRAGYGIGVAVWRFVGIGVLSALPVVAALVRAWLLTGNPVYPFAPGLFGANPDRAPLDWVFAHYGVGYSPLARLLAPWHLFSQGAAFENGHYLSPLPVLMAPVIVLRAFRDRHLRAPLGAAAVAWLAIWAMGAHVARYVVPIEPVLAALAADALVWLAEFGGRRRVIAVVTTVGLLLLGSAGTLIYDRQFAAVTFGRQTADAYLRRNTWYYDELGDACAAMPPDGRILTNAQRPTFYLPCAQGRATDADFTDPLRLRTILADGRYSHILLLGDAGLEDSVARLGVEVQLVWRRDVVVLTRRSLGETAHHPVALYQVTRAAAR